MQLGPLDKIRAIKDLAIYLVLPYLIPLGDWARYIAI